MYLQPTLPARYRLPARHLFDQTVADVLKPGARVLDVGGGRAPTIPVERRPAGCHYVGLDVSARELSNAPPGAYDATIVADVTEWRPELADQFDLIVSYQVLEHVRPLAGAIANLRSYLKPGGVLVMQLSGSLAVFALLNRVIPGRAARWAMSVLLGRDPESVFPAYYDDCHYRRLRRLFSDWSRVRITARFHGAVYFSFLGPLMAAYLVYENWAARHHPDLATHYMVVAER